MCSGGTHSDFVTGTVELMARSSPGSGRPPCLGGSPARLSGHLATQVGSLDV
jgi:hypothetical protein